MKISTQNAVLRKNFTEKETIKILADAGYDCIDFSFISNEKDLLVENKDYYINMAPELKDYAQSLGVYFNQAHAPFPSTVGDENVDKVIFKSIINSMEIASKLGVKTIVVHPVQHLKYSENKERLKEMNYEFYSLLVPYCEKFNINVAAENMWQAEQNDGHTKIVHSTCADSGEFKEYIDMIDSPRIVACLDVGHCALVGEDIENMIHTLGSKRLKALHIHDVDFVRDCHNLPGLEKMDFGVIVKALSDIGYEGEFTLEADSFLKGFEKEFMPYAAQFMAKRARFLADMI